ncbi:NAD(P)H-dependent oxidoreductase [Curvivirga sp.]|uniref:NAD(P)H-dependent oxidoreductase n=1 Tax=Curvivirga sp. TaxID=2856848 RepID=UPI003B5CC89B
MKCLLVTIHPLTNSLCKHLSSHVADTLQSQGHEVTIEDLYEQNFQPALTADERRSFYDDPYDSSSVLDEVERLLETELLVLVFPTWWFSFPAMLKGWFDRVWGPGIAYDHANDLGPISPKLKNLKEVVVVTTLGSPWWVDRLIMRQPVKKVIKYGLLGACTKNCRLQFLSLYESENLDEGKLKAFKTKINKAFQNLK